MVNISTKIGGLTLKNPVLTASGTFGYGAEYKDLVNLNSLGGIIVKGTTLNPREGNDYPRMAETPSGMLNAVGLQNKGGASVTDYVAVAERISELDKINAIEVNISCPNVKQGGMAFGTTTEGASEITTAIRKVYHKTLIVKLSPNVTDIVSIAKAVEDSGADSVSLINTLLGMAIDVERQKPVLSTITGGLSGPAVRPVAVRMVWQVAKAVKIPVIGLGGIASGRDAMEFILAGASAVQVGTANFIYPNITLEIINYIKEYCTRHNVKDITELIGAVNK